MSKDMIAILILTLLTVIAWVGFDVYHAHTKTTIPEEIKILMQPIDKTLDTNFIQELKKLEGT